MSNNFKILETNDHLDLLTGVYQNKTISFRDPLDDKLPRSLRKEVEQVFAAVNDTSLFSLDLSHALQTTTLVKALSARPYNFLRTLNLGNIGNALDLTQDLGGVAHFLSEYASSVDSIKLNPDVAAMAQKRCATKGNIITISEDLERLKLEDGYYDLIVIGNLGDLKLSSDNLDNYLLSLQASLSPQGVLVCSVLNKSRLSRWFNAQDMTCGTDINFRDLYGKPFCSKPDMGNSELGITGAQSTADITVKEVELANIRRSLRSANFAAIDVHATFSSNGNYNNLFSSDYLSNGLHPINHFYRMGSLDNSEINEFLLFKNLHENKTRLIDIADQYLLVAGSNNQDIRRVYDNDFSHFPGTGRKVRWRTITTRARSAPTVEKIPAYSPAKHKSKLLAQNLDPQPFQHGHLLIEDWLTAILNNDGERFKKLVDEYSDWLNELSQSEDFQKIAYDLLPFNIIVKQKNHDRELCAIDTEWQLNKNFSPDFILFRALFWFAFENSTLLKHYAEHHHCPTIGMFIVSNMSNINITEDLESFVKLEEKIHAKISNEFRKRSVHYSLVQPLFRVQSENKNALSVQAGWSAKSKTAAELNSSDTVWAKSSLPEFISVQLPPQKAKQTFLNLKAESSSGAYELSSLKIVDKNKETIWSATTPKKINAAVSIKRALHRSKYFALRSAEPSITFDLSDVENIDESHTLIVEIGWLTSHHNERLINTNLKSDLVDHAMLTRANKLNEYRADNESKARRINYLVDRSNELNKHIEDVNRARNDLRRQVNDLHTRLQDQIVRNDELHGFLLMRAGTRAKRVANRALHKISGGSIGANEQALLDQELAEQAAAKAIEEAQKTTKPKGYIGQNHEDYDLWVEQYTLSNDDIVAAKAEIDAMSYLPLFSILVPIYNTDPEYLIAMIRSVQNQIYPHWQLCLVDDCSPKSYLRGILEHEAEQDERITIQLNDVNQGIALTTNDALAMAKGDYVALLDHDDELSIDALYENAKVINHTPSVGLIYSDEDKMDMQGKREEPYFKPDYSPDLLHTNNYICHFSVIKKTIAVDIGGFREGLDGSQDHDLILRAAVQAERVIHIPKILYHWRKIPGSTAVVYDSKSYAWEAGRKAVEGILSDQEEGVRIELGSLKGTYRVFREIKGEPLVSIIVPFKDKPELLDSCLNSILNRSSYTNFEIIGVSNNSEQELTAERMEHFKKLDDRIKFVEKNIPFNFSAICNFGAEHANGEYIVLLNNDIEIISPDWIERMLEHAQRPNIGAVGGKLLYPDGRVQHAGVVVGMVGAAGHPHKFFPDEHIGYHGRLHMVYNVSAVTGAMMMTRLDKFNEVGGLDEDNLAIAYNDIDLCLKLMDKGYDNLFTPHARATHHESVSRGYEDTDEKMQRLLSEQSHFLTKWDDFLKNGDPYYNPNLSLKNEKFSLKYKDE